MPASKFAEKGVTHLILKSQGCIFQPHTFFQMAPSTKTFILGLRLVRFAVMMSSAELKFKVYQLPKEGTFLNCKSIIDLVVWIEQSMEMELISMVNRISNSIPDE